MAKKKVKVDEQCIITTDDKGQRTLVAAAKEALTTLSKNNVDVTVFLRDTPEDEARKFLESNNVPFTALLPCPRLSEKSEHTEPSEKPKFDATILPAEGHVLLRYGWSNTLDNLVDCLYGSRTEHQQSEQDRMDQQYKQYREWADKANKCKHGDICR